MSDEQAVCISKQEQDGESRDKRSKRRRSPSPVRRSSAGEDTREADEKDKAVPASKVQRKKEPPRIEPQKIEKKPKTAKELIMGLAEKLVSLLQENEGIKRDPSLRAELQKINDWETLFKMATYQSFEGWKTKSDTMLKNILTSYSVSLEKDEFQRVQKIFEVIVKIFRDKVFAKG